MAKEMDRNTHTVYDKDKIGEVQIADEVVAIIAKIDPASIQMCIVQCF